MSTRFLDGFDYLPATGTPEGDAAFNHMLAADGYWGAWYGNGQGLYTGPGRFNQGQCLFFGDPPGGIDAYRPLGWVFNEGFVWGFAGKMTPDAYDKFIYLRNSQALTTAFTIKFLGAPGAGVIEFLSAFGVARTRTGAIKSNTWFYLEIRYIGSSFQVLINGDVVIDLTGVNTPPAGIDSMRFSAGYATRWMALDDMYMNDPSDGDTNLDYLGNIVVRSQLPVGAGDLTDLTPSNPNKFNWEIAADKSMPVTQFNFTPDVGDSDLYEMNPSAAARQIHAVGVKGFYMQDNGVQLFGQNQIKVDGEIHAGTQQGLNQMDFGSIVDYWDLNPVTNSTWSNEDLNEFQAGPKLGASA